MTTEYQVRLNRDTCDGVFACLARDDRFVEASDGLATMQGAGSEDVLIERFTDDRLDDARRAARACPVNAIDVTVVDDE